MRTALHLLLVVPFSAVPFSEVPFTTKLPFFRLPNQATKAPRALLGSAALFTSRSQAPAEGAFSAVAPCESTARQLPGTGFVCNHLLEMLPHRYTDSGGGRRCSRLANLSGRALCTAVTADGYEVLKSVTYRDFTSLAHLASCFFFFFFFFFFSRYYGLVGTDRGDDCSLRLVDCRLLLTARELKKEGFGAAELRGAGFHAYQLKPAGFTAAQVPPPLPPPKKKETKKKGGVICGHIYLWRLKSVLFCWHLRSAAKEASNQGMSAALGPR